MPTPPIPVRRLLHPSDDRLAFLSREWLVTNGLGGYASGTISGVVTRRYHGMLVSALPAPIGRMVMLSAVNAQLRLPSGDALVLAPERPLQALQPLQAGQTSADGPAAGSAAAFLTEFRLELGMPVWRYEADGIVVEKRVLMPHAQNTAHLVYRLIEGPAIMQIELRPFMNVRHYESPLQEAITSRYAITALNGRFEVLPGGDLPVLRLLLYGNQSALTLDGSEATHGYSEEQDRGYAYQGSLWTPGYFHAVLKAGSSDCEATLVASTESWETVVALTPAAALQTETNRRLHVVEQAPVELQTGLRAELVLAADQFLVTPAARPEDATRAVALGTQARTLIAGYHWFTDWGRDTMISLEGLTIVTGRAHEAALILRTFASYVRDGLIPNMFPDGERQGLYHTADATLWYFHAVARYVAATGDRDTLRILLPVLRDIIDHHIRGTRFGIGVDPADGLLRQGQDGYALTWMDAKVGDWVVTPRRGKAVEINALFYNAVCLLESWVRAEDGESAAGALKAQAERMRASFNQRFWYEAGTFLYDVVDGERGDDPACRPNQVLAISLPHPILDESRWPAVLQVVQDRLLTPYGLRTLSVDHPDFRKQYFGDLKTRDGAYHQGTVWPWLLGPFIDAWLRVHPDGAAAAAHFLDAFDSHLSEAGVGSVSEIFDAVAPYSPRGCISQAWSVAELLRALVRLSPLA